MQSIINMNGLNTDMSSLTHFEGDEMTLEEIR